LAPSTIRLPLMCGRACRFFLFFFLFLGGFILFWCFWSLKSPIFLSKSLKKKKLTPVFTIKNTDFASKSHHLHQISHQKSSKSPQKPLFYPQNPSNSPSKPPKIHYQTPPALAVSLPRCSSGAPFSPASRGSTSWSRLSRCSARRRGRRSTP
jgi:hypothetical protein